MNEWDTVVGSDGVTLGALLCREYSLSSKVPPCNAQIHKSRSKKNCANNSRCLYGLEGRSSIFFNKNIGDDIILKKIGADPSINLRKHFDEFSGLRNLGATCYANSLLQCLFMNLSFRRGVYAWENPTKMNEILTENPISNEGPMDDAIQVIKLGSSSQSLDRACYELQLLFCMLQNGVQKVVDPTPLINLLGLNTGIQQDAQEFNKLLLTFLDNKFMDCNLPAVQRLVPTLFSGKQAYETTCLSCGRSVSRSSQYHEITLSISGHTDLMSSLHYYLAPSRLDGNNQYFCESCGGKVDAETKIVLQTLPNVLNIQLMRFLYVMDSYGGGSREKLSSSLQFPHSIDMSPFVSGDCDSDFVYDLTAVLLHQGESSFSGHYLSYLKHPISNDWVAFDDEEVTLLQNFNVGPSNRSHKKRKIPSVTSDKVNSDKISESSNQYEQWKMAENNAYMLIYMRRSLRESDQIEGIPQPPKAVSNEVDSILNELKANVENYRHQLELANKDRLYRNHVYDSVVGCWENMVSEKSTVESIECSLDCLFPRYCVPVVVLTKWLGYGACLNLDVATDDIINAAEKNDLSTYFNEYLCEHGRVSPWHAGELKHLTEEGWLVFSKSCNGVGPALGITDHSSLCVPCTLKKYSDELNSRHLSDEKIKWQNEIETALKMLLAVARDPSIGNSEKIPRNILTMSTSELLKLCDGMPMNCKFFWVSRSWYRDWLKHDWISRDFDFQNGIVSNEDDVKFNWSINGNLRCIHSTHEKSFLKPLLSADGARIAVTADAWNYFVAASGGLAVSFSDTNVVCELCDIEVLDSKLHGRRLVEIKKEERKLAKSLVGEAIYDMMTSDSGDSFLGVGKDGSALSGLSLLSWGPGRYVVIASKWVEDWFDFLCGRSKEGPGSLSTRDLLCQHEYLYSDPFSEDFSREFILCQEEIFNSLCSTYPGGDEAVRVVVGCDEKIPILDNFNDNTVNSCGVPICGPCLRIRKEAMASAKFSYADETFFVIRSDKCLSNVMDTIPVVSEVVGVVENVRKSRRSIGQTNHSYSSSAKITASSDDTIRRLKCKIRGVFDISPDDQRLFIDGNDLSPNGENDQKTMAEVGIGSGKTIIVTTGMSNSSIKKKSAEEIEVGFRGSCLLRGTSVNLSSIRPRSYSGSKMINDIDVAISLSKGEGPSEARKYVHENGNRKQSKKFKDFAPYDAASKYMQETNIRTCLQFRNDFCKGKRPGFIPYQPDITYRGKGWRGWKHFLSGKDDDNYDSNNNRSKNYNVLKHCNDIDSNDATFVESPSLDQTDSSDITLLDSNEDSSASKSDNQREVNLEPKIVSKVFISYEEASRFMKSFNIKSIAEFRLFSRSGKRPDNIPSNPDRTYVGKGWIGWRQFFGVEKDSPRTHMVCVKSSSDNSQSYSWNRIHSKFRISPSDLHKYLIDDDRSSDSFYFAIRRALYRDEYDDSE